MHKVSTLPKQQRQNRGLRLTTQDSDFKHHVRPEKDGSGCICEWRQGCAGHVMLAELSRDMSGPPETLTISTVTVAATQ